MHVAVIGCGHIGVVVAACLAELGHGVIYVDRDSAKIDSLIRGDRLIHEKYLPELLLRHCGVLLLFSYDFAEAVRRSTVVILAVGTAADATGEAYLSYVETAVHETAKTLNGIKLLWR